MHTLFLRLILVLFSYLYTVKQKCRLLDLSALTRWRIPQNKKKKQKRYVKVLGCLTSYLQWWQREMLVRNTIYGIPSSSTSLQNHWDVLKYIPPQTLIHIYVPVVHQLVWLFFFWKQLFHNLLWQQDPTIHYYFPLTSC